MVVVHVRSETEYAALLGKSAPRLLIVDFTATWCGPCQRIKPVYEALSQKYRQSIFAQVDVDECSEVAGSNNVRAMPTFLFVKNGKEIDRIQGADPSALENKIIEHSTGSAMDSFSGEGQKLGGAGSAGQSSPSLSSPPEDCKKLEEQAQASVGVDESKPTTKVQIRLADGSKLTVRLNLSHPIAKIREFISNARSGSSSRVYALMTTFPTAEISDENMTIEEAKLANAVVVQKIK